jgi:hypothetical protein
MDEDDPRDQYRSSSLDDDDRFRSEYYSNSAKIPNTLDASSLADTIPESAKNDLENDVEGPNLDSKHVQNSDTIHELLYRYRL